jgi:hypothetical protein
MTYSSRFFLYLPAGLLVLAAALYVWFWREEAGQFGAALDRVNGREILPGLGFAFAEKSMGGFPFRLDAVLSGVTFSHRVRDGEYAWRSEHLVLHTQSYDWTRFVFEAAGVQSLARPPAETGGVPRILLVRPGIMRASAILEAGRLARFDLDIRELRAEDATLGAAPGRTVAAARAQFHIISRPDQTLDLALQVEEARLGEGLSGQGLGSRLPLVSLSGVLTQAAELEGLLSGWVGLPEAAETWRAGHGAFRIRSLTLKTSDRQAVLTGELTLAETGEVSGALQGETGMRLVFEGGGLRLETGSAAGLAGP